MCVSFMCYLFIIIVIVCMFYNFYFIFVVYNIRNTRMYNAIHNLIISINIVARRQENIEYYEDYYDLTL